MLGEDTIFGLPVHALVVHFAVVLVPLAAVGVVATAVRRDWRQRYLLPIALIAVLGAGAAFMAAQSGESLEHTVKDSARQTGTPARFAEHPEQGQRAEILAMVLAACTVGLFVMEQPLARDRGITDLHVNGAVVGCAVVAVLALGAMVIAGHSGAALVWRDLGNFVRGTG
jgi:hypothetical protein